MIARCIREIAEALKRLAVKLLEEINLDRIGSSFHLDVGFRKTAYRVYAFIPDSYHFGKFK